VSENNVNKHDNAAFQCFIFIFLRHAAASLTKYALFACGTYSIGTQYFLKDLTFDPLAHMSAAQSYCGSEYPEILNFLVFVSKYD